MFDFNVSLEFKPEIVMPQKGTIDQLIISSCALHYCGSDNRILSDYEDLCFNELNPYEVGFGFLDIEVGLTGYSGTPYPKVYTKCFRLFTDNWMLIKPMKMTNQTSDSKVNRRGETVIGFRYYFQSQEEIDKLRTCGKLMFDSFFALNSPKNTYALACQLCKKDCGWAADYANTYRRKEKEDITGLVD